MVSMGNFPGGIRSTTSYATYKGWVSADWQPFVRYTMDAKSSSGEGVFQLHGRETFLGKEKGEPKGNTEWDSLGMPLAVPAVRGWEGQEESQKREAKMTEGRNERTGLNRQVSCPGSSRSSDALFYSRCRVSSLSQDAHRLNTRGGSKGWNGMYGFSWCLPGVRQ